MSDVMEINATTGEVTERDFTAAEVKQRATDQVEATLRATEATRVATVTAARTHALSLGFTDAMLAVMYPTLAP